MDQNQGSLGNWDMLEFGLIVGWTGANEFEEWAPGGVMGSDESVVGGGGVWNRIVTDNFQDRLN